MSIFPLLAHRISFSFYFAGISLISEIMSVALVALLLLEQRGKMAFFSVLHPTSVLFRILLVHI